jgi:hypothetical protein
MPSKSALRQHVTIALVEGLLDMLWEQDYRHRKRNATFQNDMRMIKERCAIIRAFLTKEGGHLTTKDIKKVQVAIDYMKNTFLISGKHFTPMMGIAIFVDMVVYQISITKGEKQRLFNKLLYKINGLVRRIDQQGKWEDKDDLCLKAAEALRRKINEI